MIKAIVKGFRIDAAVPHWSRHATPVAFTHLCVSGPTGRAILTGLDPAAVGLFVFGHPTLGQWTAVPAFYKRPDGGPLHVFAGVTPDMPADPAPIVDPETGQTVTVAQQFAAKNAVELYVRGHLVRHTSRSAGDDSLYVAMGLTNATLLNAIKPAAIVYRSDTMLWADVPARYKKANGAPRVDPDDAHDTALVSWSDPAAALPVIP